MKMFTTPGSHRALFRVFTMRLTSVALVCILGGHAQGQECTSVTDVDGNTYPVVQIGTQCWMAENLRTGHYRDGTEIPNVTDDAAWAGSTTGAWCNYNNSLSDSIWGRLYNGDAIVDTNGLCPSGWHVPTDAEWTILVNHLGGADLAGGKLKATGSLGEGTGLWGTPNTGATNETGFSAIPGGSRYWGFGDFEGQHSKGIWWSSTAVFGWELWYRQLRSDSEGVQRFNDPRAAGYSVRCLLGEGPVGMIEPDPIRFTVAPNPTSGPVTIRFMPNNRPVLIGLLDATGRLVETRPVIAATSIRIDMSRYEKGLYTVHAVFDDGTRAAERLVKE